MLGLIVMVDSRHTIKINEENFKMLIGFQAEMVSRTGKKVTYDEIIQKALTLLKSASK